jgi:hypothetical protein
MPQQVTVAVGRSAGDLQEVRDVHIPSNVTGYVTLLENANINQLCESNKISGREGREAIFFYQHGVWSLFWKFDFLFMTHTEVVITSFIKCY